jgi:RNA polymerase sigma-70 factor, ECF subfamily
MVNDNRLLEECYITYGPMVLRRCHSILLDRDAAHDAMQEVFIRIITHREAARADTLSSYLYRIATNICLNMIRDNHTIPVNPSSGIIPILTSRDNYEEILIAQDYIDYIFRDETQLTRQIAYFYYAEGRSLNDVSDSTTISVSCISKRMRELRRKIIEREKELVYF